MSLAKVKAKEIKGKQKVLPKLKPILAYPNRTKCPVLDEREMNNLKILLHQAIKESKLEPRKFAIEKGICLGLESSLRKINNSTCSCVFISLSIKPSYIIGLIARNAEVKNKSQPVYAQPKLENFIEELFGIQAVCMVFPKNLIAINENVMKWVENHLKIPKVHELPPDNKNNVVKKKIKQQKKGVPSKLGKKEIVSPAVNKVKSWSGDFISFDNESPIQINDSKMERVEAVDALSKIMDKIPSSSKIMQKSEPMEVDDNKDVAFCAESNALVDDDSKDSDDFLCGYKALTVHKIKGNPNKNPKKKRKKNKKKKTN